jgi:hypothetical protein
LSGPSDAAPLPHETPFPKQVGLNVEAIIPAHVALWVGAVQGDGVHGANLLHPTLKDQTTPVNVSPPVSKPFGFAIVNALLNNDFLDN